MEPRPTSSWDIGALDLSIYLYPSFKLIVAQRNAGWALAIANLRIMSGASTVRVSAILRGYAAVARHIAQGHLGRSRLGTGVRVSACPGTPIRIQEANK